MLFEDFGQRSACPFGLNIEHVAPFAATLAMPAINAVLTLKDPRARGLVSVAVVLWTKAMHRPAFEFRPSRQEFGFEFIL
ncbi:MAG: hypothetical protein GXY41_04515 [Phycisphaerae bacterium]|nr:hypothetical protein [Phycisphaerae bacterium]